MITEIISGIIVAIISFVFGYFLFLVKRKESIRLELYKKRLESYDKILSFVNKVDREIIAKDFELTKEEKNNFVEEIYSLTLPRMPYISKEISHLLEPEMVYAIDGLPDSAHILENLNERLKFDITDEIGAFLIEPKKFKKIVGFKSKYADLIRDLEFFESRLDENLNLKTNKIERKITEKFKKIQKNLKI